MAATAKSQITTLRLQVHIFDGQTDFCKRCGCSKVDYDEGRGRRCTNGQNVFGISHLIERKRQRVRAEQDDGA